MEEYSYIVGVSLDNGPLLLDIKKTLEEVEKYSLHIMETYTGAKIAVLKVSGNIKYEKCYKPKIEKIVLKEGF